MLLEPPEGPRETEPVEDPLRLGRRRPPPLVREPVGVPGPREIPELREREDRSLRHASLSAPPVDVGRRPANGRQPRRYALTLVALDGHEDDGPEPLVERLADPAATPEAACTSTSVTAAAPANLAVDIIWVVDASGSMAEEFETAAQVLAGFASKVYFGGLEWADAEYASRQAGVTTVYLPAEDDEGPGSWAERGAQVARMLLLPEEVARPPVNPLLGAPVTVFLPDAPPFLAYLPPAYQVQELAAALGQEVGGDAGWVPGRGRRRSRARRS